MRNSFSGRTGKEIDLHDKTAREVCLWVAAFCLVLIGIGGAKVLSFRSQIKNMVETVATVQSCEMTADQGYQSTLEFTVAGEPFTASIDGFQTVGTSLTIAYDEKDPGSPVLAGTSQMLRKGLIGVIGAVMLLSLGLSILKGILRKKREAGQGSPAEESETEDDE